ncbi:hypothetical protein LTR53_003022 [Teratosphaeriaceae sp. CCFEE 6253]|nr:hypothetical protein LTR53_003022 [Teratosphaeriaceae sp. CCFEE 6253]
MARLPLFHILTALVSLLTVAIDAQAPTPTPSQTWTPSPVCSNGLATPSSLRGTYSDAYGANWDVECAQDSTGFVYNVQGTSGFGVYGCFRGCDNSPGCTGFSFIGSVTSPNTGSGQCYYRYQAGTYYANATVYAGANLISNGTPNLPCPYYNGSTYSNCDGSVYQVYCSANYGGASDLSTTQATSMAGCMSSCAQTAGCVFFVFAYTGSEPGPSGPTQRSGTCYLKSNTFVASAVYGAPSNAVAAMISSATVSTMCDPTVTASTVTSSTVAGTSSGSTTTGGSGTTSSAPTTTPTTTATTASSSSPAASSACTSAPSPNLSTLSCSGANAGAGNIGTFTDACGSSYTVYCGYDTQPGASYTLGANSIQACMQLCDNQPGCLSATFLPNTCYLKTGFTGVTISGTSTLAGLIRYAPNAAYPSPTPAAGFVNASTGCGSALPAGLSIYGGSVAFSMVTPDDYNRTWNLKIPQYYSANSASPLILAFPGNGESASNIEGQTGYSSSNVNPYAIAAYVTGVGLGFQSNPAYTPGNTYAGVDDIGFIKLLIANLTATYCIDTGRIFATGHSNGGGFCGVLACDPVLSRSIAAFAPNSGALYTNISSSTNPDPNTMEPLNTAVQALCSPSRNDVAIIEFHGTADTQIAYAGSITHARLALPSLPHWATDWSIRQGRGATNVTSYQAPLTGPNVDPTANITISQFGSGADLGRITHYRLEQWIHAYPNPANDNRAPISVGPIAMAFFYRWTNYGSSPPSSSSSASGSSSTGTATVSSSVTSTTSTSTTSSSSSTSTAITTIRSTSATAYSCPDVSGQVLTDSYNNQFVVQCGADTTLGSYDVLSAANSWNDCFDVCQASTAQGSQTCTGFTYGGANNGAGSGSCFIKNAVSAPNARMSFKPASSPAANYVGAIMTQYYYAAGDTLSTTTTTASSTSQTTSTSSSTTTTTSSSSAAATPTASCPSANGTIVDDGTNQYEIGCGYVSSPSRVPCSPSLARSKS